MPFRNKRRLKRALGLFEVSIYGIGVILGAGIYALIGKGAASAGNSLWLAFLFGAIIASLTGLSYAELGTIYPKEAAEYVYSRKAFKKPSLSFLIGWLEIAVDVVAASTVALGFGGYFYSLTGINPLIAAMGLVVVLSFINFYGIKESAKFNIIFTLIEVFGLLLIIILGINYFGSVNYFESPSGFTGIFSATILVFFAYIGFEEMVNVAEETKKPKRVLPIAIIVSLIVTTIIYILVSLSVVSILPWNLLGASEAPLADVAGKALPGSSLLLSAVALFATGNTVLIMLIVGSRMIYGMAHERGVLPKSFSRIHSKRRTPWIAILTVMILTIGFISFGNIKMVAEITDLGTFLVFLTVNLSLIWLRYKKPRLKRVFKVPLSIGKLPIIPLLGILSILFMLMYFGLEIYLVCFAIILSGFFVYLLLRRKQVKFK